jgi:pimeloyl-ACP methyl ester carboxylesterase
MNPEFHVYEDDQRRLNFARLGEADNPVLICLHGFPEFCGGWSEIMPYLAERFLVIAPDQRGYAKSFKPKGVDAYRARNMVEDLNALAGHVAPDRPFLLFGHDWGASVAYAFAFRYPDRLKGLVIANGVHPVLFQRAILFNAEQRAASQYINKLRAEGAEIMMSKDGFARTFNMIAGFTATDWMNDVSRAAYLEAWSEEGAMESMLNWYRASSVAVPSPDDDGEAIATSSPLLSADPATVTVRVPHLVIWGEDDRALRPVCLEGLDAFAPDLTVRKVANSGHWILHERPAEVADIVRAWAIARDILKP